MSSRLARGRRRAAYTLVELAVSITAGSLLLAGMMSSMYLAGRAVNPPGPMRDIQAASEVIRDFTDAVRNAVFITARSDRMIQFSVTDMTGDGQTDVVRYEWSGTAGEPLLRTVNHGTPVVAAAGVQEFALSYGLRTKVEQFEAPRVESGEVTLSELSSGSSPADYEVLFDKAPGECFAPALPTGADVWSVTKVRLDLRANDIDNDGRFRIQFRPATAAGTPTSVVLGEVVVDESTLGSGYAAKEYDVLGVDGLSATQRLCLVLLHDAPQTAKACMARYESGSVSTPNHGLLESNNGGTSWTITTDKGLRFRVKGKYLEPAGGPHAVTRAYVAGLRVSLRTGASGETRLQSQAPLPNCPEILSAFRKTDFDGDPRLLDSDRDGAGDWSEEAGSLDPSTMSGGVWFAGQSAGTSLRTAGGIDFSGLTTAEIRCRNVTYAPTGDGASFRLHADRSGSTSAAIHAAVKRQADGSQTARVYFKPSDTAEKTVCEVTGLGAGFVDVRLVVDPTSDVVAAWVGGVWRGTATYATYATGDKPYCAVGPSDSDAEFDYVCVRVGG